jgi:hypothetical protein
MAITWTQNGRRLKGAGTITAPGTPILLMPGMQQPVVAQVLAVQIEAGSTGIIKVYNDLPVYDTGSGTTYPTAANVPSVCGPPEQIGPGGTTSVPGGQYVENADSEPFALIDVRTYAIDGTVIGDTFSVDVRLKV